MLKTNYTSLPPFQATTRKHLNSIQAYTWFANTNISLQPHLSNLYKIKINYRDGITSFARYQEKNFFEKKSVILSFRFNNLQYINKIQKLTKAYI